MPHIRHLYVSVTAEGDVFQVDGRDFLTCGADSAEAGAFEIGGCFTGGAFLTEGGAFEIGGCFMGGADSAEGDVFQIDGGGSFTGGADPAEGGAFHLGGCFTGGGPGGGDDFAPGDATGGALKIRPLTVRGLALSVAPPHRLTVANSTMMGDVSGEAVA